MNSDKYFVIIIIITGSHNIYRIVPSSLLYSVTFGEFQIKHFIQSLEAGLFFLDT